MPVVFRREGLRFFFYSNEGTPREPHVHVRSADREAKIWLTPGVSIADSYGFTPRELARILRIATDERETILRAWHDHFTDGGAF
jgi:hypothetical protein